MKLQAPHRDRPRPALRPAAARPARQSPRCAPEDRSACPCAMSMRVAFRQILLGHAENARQFIERGRGSLAQLAAASALFRPVAKHAQRKSLLHHVAHPVLRIHWRHLPDRRAGRQHFDQREAQPAHLVLHGALDRPRRLRNLLVVAQAHALNVDRRLAAWPATRSHAADSLRSQRCGRSAWWCSFAPAAWWARPARRSCCRWRCSRKSR